MNIAVCDDNCRFVKKISNALIRYYNLKFISANIEAFYSSEGLIGEIEDGIKFDVIFLGVEEDGKINIETAYRLRDLGFVNDIILVSSTVSYAIDGFCTKASGYILKSWDYSSMKNVMDRITDDLLSDVYLIKQRSSIFKIYVKDIVYIESDNTKCFIYTANGKKHVVYKHLSKIEEELSNDMFLRCHQSYLVNMNYVESVDKEFILQNGSAVCIRQKSLKEMRSRFVEFFNSKSSF